MEAVADPLRSIVEAVADLGWMWLDLIASLPGAALAFLHELGDSVQRGDYLLAARVFVWVWMYTFGAAAVVGVLRLVLDPG